MGQENMVKELMKVRDDLVRQNEEQTKALATNEEKSLHLFKENQVTLFVFLILQDMTIASVPSRVSRAACILFE